MVIFPDAEGELAAWLASSIAAKLAQPVAGYAGTTPESWPTRSVSAVRIGGLTSDKFHDRARISFDFRHADSESKAERLSATGRAAALALPDTQVAGSLLVTDVIEVASPYLNPDPSNPLMHRYTAAFEFIVRGTVA